MLLYLQSLKIQRLGLVAISHGIEGSLFSLSCWVGSLITIIFYVKHLVVLLYLVLHVYIAFAVRITCLVSSVSFNGGVKWLHIDLLAWAVCCSCPCFGMGIPSNLSHSMIFWSATGHWWSVKFLKQRNISQYHSSHDKMGMEGTFGVQLYKNYGWEIVAEISFWESNHEHSSCSSPWLPLWLSNLGNISLDFLAFMYFILWR